MDNVDPDLVNLLDTQADQTDVTNVHLRSTQEDTRMLEPDVVDRIRELSGQGLGSKRIARQLGISRNSVRRYLAGATVGFQERLAARRLDGPTLSEVHQLFGTVAEGNTVVIQQELPSARQLVRRFRDQAALRTGSGNLCSGRTPSRRQASSSPFRRAASSAAKASTPCGDQLIPWCLQRADTAQSLYFSTRVLAIHNPARCRCW